MVVSQVATNINENARQDEERKKVVEIHRCETVFFWIGLAVIVCRDRLGTSMKRYRKIKLTNQNGGRFVKHSRFKAPKADDSQAIYALASLVQPRRLFLKSIGVQAAELKTAGTYSGEY